MNRHLYAVARINVHDPVERAFQHRKLVALLRWRAAGFRPASIRRYARRAYPGPFVRALRAEMDEMVASLSFRNNRPHCGDRDSTPT